MLGRGLIDLFHDHCCCKSLTHLRQMDGECRGMISLCVCECALCVWMCGWGVLHGLSVYFSWCGTSNRALQHYSTHLSTEGKRCMLKYSHQTALTANFQQNVIPVLLASWKDQNLHACATIFILTNYIKYSLHCFMLQFNMLILFYFFFATDYNITNHGLCYIKLWKSH